VKLSKSILKNLIKEELKSLLEEENSPCIELVGIELDNMKRRGVNFSEEQKQQVYDWARKQMCSSRRLNHYRRKLETLLQRMSQQ
jgi:hypothetical protein